MIYETLEQLLNEFFTNVHEGSVDFSLGDLFESSHFRLHDVFLKTEVLNALGLPFEIKGGYIHEARVEGFMGVMMGSPLTLCLNNICLVLSPQAMDWNNELRLRYIQELIMAVLQNLWKPLKSSSKSASTDDSTFVSPVKWITKRFEAAIANMTIRLENIHIRFESTTDDHKPMAYGLYLPMIRFSTMDVERQILHRRQQYGVEYPSLDEEITTSKLLCLENVSFYCDLDHPTCFCQPNDANPTREEALRAHAMASFPSKAHRDLLFAAAIWLKLDFTKITSSTSKEPAKITLACVDLVTEALEIHLDFHQITALMEQVDRLTAFLKASAAQFVRPSCINRELVVPPTVQLIANRLLPRVESPEAFSFPREKQRKSSRWFRMMWKVATYRILLQRRHGNRHLLRFTLDGPINCPDPHVKDLYIELYRRQLSPEMLQVIVEGKSILTKAKGVPPSEDTTKKPVVPTGPPLSMEEQWTFSDLVYYLPKRQQLQYRAQADQMIRSMATTTNTTTSTTATQAAASVLSPRSGSIATTSSSTTSSSFPPEFIANHHHITRSATESALHTSSPPPSPSSFGRVHAASTSVLGSNSKPSSPMGKSKVQSPPTSYQLSKQFWFQCIFLPSWMIKRQLPLINWHIGKIALTVFHQTPSSASSQPTSPTKTSSTQAPVAPITSFMAKFTSDPASASPSEPSEPSDPSSQPSESPDSSSKPPEPSKSGREVFLEASFDGCTGSVLIRQSPSVCFLMECRLGLFAATLFHGHGQNGANSITSDYIREPEDGFLYMGLKYNCKQPPTPPSFLAPPPIEWDLKSKICVGMIKIDYNELDLQTAIQLHGQNSTQTPRLRLSQRFPSTEPASYFALVHDVYQSWTTFFHRLRTRKKDQEDDEEDHEEAEHEDEPDAVWVRRTKDVLSKPPPHKKKPTRHASVSTKDAQRQLTKRYKMAKLLHAILLHTSNIEIDVNGLEIRMTLMTSHLETLLHTKSHTSKTYEQQQQEGVHVILSKSHCEVESRPLLDQCHVEVAGNRMQFHTTKQGRKALIEYLLHRLCPMHA